MTLVVGTDEAGYGPNLGPLVVAATAWQVDAAPPAAEATLAAAAAAASHGPGRPLWADSKLVLRGKAGLAALETGALTGVALVAGATPADWAGLTAAVGCAPGSATPEDERLAALALPLTAEAQDAGPRAAAVGGRLAALGVTLAAIRARVVWPGEFNALLGAGLNKADIVSRVTLDLAATLVAGEPGPALVWCDRHGGRRRYAGLVARHFGATLVRTAEETALRSAYELPTEARRIEFSVGGEARGPVALASMTAKYVREVCMRAFNEFWGSRCPGLAPTAGYPVDALRWRREAAAAVAREQVAWDEVWRRA